MGTYSFLDVVAAISGPGGIIPLGDGAGVADEGITVSMIEEKDTMTIGADGAVMHSLHASKASRITVRLLKTSPTNFLLNAMYNFQTTSAANHGRNVITVANPQRGDIVTAQECAFTKLPDYVNAKEGNIVEWEFNCGKTDEIIGIGSPST